MMTNYAIEFQRLDAWEKDQYRGEIIIWIPNRFYRMLCRLDQIFRDWLSR